MKNELNTKGKLQQRARSLIAGTHKHLPNEKLTVGGTTYESAALVQILQSLDNAIAASDEAKAKSKDALKNKNEVHAKVGPVLRAYQSYLFASLGNTPSTLADFGLAPRKERTPPKVEKLAAATAKRKATREARHTMGPVQKKGVLGNVTNVVLTPVTAPEPSAATNAPTSAPTSAPEGHTQSSSLTSPR
jgi:hypothetical protein